MFRISVYKAKEMFNIYKHYAESCELTFSVMQSIPSFTFADVLQLRHLFSNISRLRSHSFVFHIGAIVDNAFSFSTTSITFLSRYHSYGFRRHYFIIFCYITKIKSTLITFLANMFLHTLHIFDNIHMY